MHVQRLNGSPTDREDAVKRPLGMLRVICFPGLASLFLGRWLADLGADVIRAEPPGGDPVRWLGPYAGDLIDADASLVWMNYAAGSRSVTVDITTDDGQQLVKRLLATADILLDAYAPGTLDVVGLGFKSLAADNPTLLQVSLSPFGQTGPSADKLSSDLVNLASSGYMHMTGPPGGAPIKPSAPYQSQLHAANHGLVALLIALRQVRKTGKGLQIDVSARETGIWMLTHTYQHYDFAGIDLKRQGAARDMGTAVRIRSVFATLDGYVVWLFQTGPANAAAIRNLVALMTEAGMAPDWLHRVRWEEVDLRTLDRQTREQYDAAFRSFFATRTNASLFDWALANRVMLAPVQTVADVLADPQLASRDSWMPLPSNPEVPTAQIPKSPVRMSRADWFPRYPAPRIGEHSVNIYRDELGMSDNEIQLVHSTGAI